MSVVVSCGTLKVLKRRRVTWLKTRGNHICQAVAGLVDKELKREELKKYKKTRSCDLFSSQTETK